MKENNRRYHRNVKNELYIYGNTVRQTRILEDPDIERKSKHQQHDKMNRAVRRNREYATSMNVGYFIFLIVAVIVTYAVCANYLVRVSAVSAGKNMVAKLEKQVADLKADNNDLERRLESSIDMEYIRRVAIEELGMVYASKGQVVVYEYQESDYVRQYEKIPDSNEESILDNVRQ